MVSVLHAVCGVLWCDVFKVGISAAFQLLPANFISNNGVALSDLINSDDGGGNLVTPAVFRRCNQTRVTQNVKLN